MENDTVITVRDVDLDGDHEIDIDLIIRLEKTENGYEIETFMSGKKIEQIIESKRKKAIHIFNTLQKEKFGKVITDGNIIP